MKRFWSLLGCCAVAISAGCSVEDVEQGQSVTEEGVTRIMIDGSSTVEPISSRVGEAFEKLNEGVQVPVKTSGTGSGFKEFAAGRTDISDASRPIKDSEREECEKNGIEFVELKVAIDGISVVVNKENDFCTALTVAQLKKLWEPGSTVKTWKDLDPSWPEEEIALYGPGEESGTFDYFTDEICGEEGECREDYSPSGDDNVLVTGVSQSKYALGYFGYAYYLKNKDKLNAVAISESDDVADAVAPTPEAIEAGDYSPLARPLFIYVKKQSLERQEVADFVRYYLNEGQAMVPEAGYVSLSEEQIEASRAALEAAIGGE